MKRSSAQREEAANGGGIAGSALLAGTVAVLALPSAVLAITAGPRQPLAAVSDSAGRESTAPDTRLDGSIPIRSLAKGRLFLFTPAKNPSQGDQAITVAVRIDPQTAKAIAVHARQLADADPGTAQLRIAPTAFNLGVSRGYRGFAPDLAPAGTARGSDLPDLSRFSLSPRARGDESRFSPRIVMDEKPTAGRAPGTFTGDREDQVDVGGSYRVTRNLNVTAGVRYSQDRERLRPLTDGKQDSQAVYVGTQFRF